MVNLFVSLLLLAVWVAPMSLYAATHGIKKGVLVEKLEAECSAAREVECSYSLAEDGVLSMERRRSSGSIETLQVNLSDLRKVYELIYKVTADCAIHHTCVKIKDNGSFRPWVDKLTWEFKSAENAKRASKLLEELVSEFEPACYPLDDAEERINTVKKDLKAITFSANNLIKAVGVRGRTTTRLTEDGRKKLADYRKQERILQSELNFSEECVDFILTPPGDNNRGTDFLHNYIYQ